MDFNDDHQLSILRQQAIAECEQNYFKDIKNSAYKATLIQKYTDPQQLQRLLIARENNLKNAFLMWQKWVVWRLSYKADQLDINEFKEEMISGKAFYHKSDKYGNPCLIIRPKFHYAKESKIDLFMKFAIYLLEFGIAQSDKQNFSGKISVIWDRKGFNYSKNFDKRMISLFKKIAQIAQDNYAERLHCIYILHANWFFRMMFGIIKPFLTQRTKDKIKICKNESELISHFDKNNLLEEYGGFSILPAQCQNMWYSNLAYNLEVSPTKLQKEMQENYVSKDMINSGSNVNDDDDQEAEKNIQMDLNDINFDIDDDEPIAKNAFIQNPNCNIKNTTF